MQEDHTLNQIQEAGPHLMQITDGLGVPPASVKRKFFITFSSFSRVFQEVKKPP
jgi:hypothetical protein